MDIKSSVKYGKSLANESKYDLAVGVLVAAISKDNVSATSSDSIGDLRGCRLTETEQLLSNLVDYRILSGKRIVVLIRWFATLFLLLPFALLIRYSLDFATLFWVDTDAFVALATIVSAIGLYVAMRHGKRNSFRLRLGFSVGSWLTMLPFCWITVAYVMFIVGQVTERSIGFDGGGTVTGFIALASLTASLFAVGVILIWLQELPCLFRLLLRLPCIRHLYSRFLLRCGRIQVKTDKLAIYIEDHFPSLLARVLVYPCSESGAPQFHSWFYPLVFAALFSSDAAGELLQLLPNDTGFLVDRVVDTHARARPKVLSLSWQIQRFWMPILPRSCSLSSAEGDDAHAQSR